MTRQRARQTCTHLGDRRQLEVVAHEGEDTRYDGCMALLEPLRTPREQQVPADIYTTG